MSGKAPPLSEMTISDLTRGQVFGEDQSAKIDHSPALPDVRPAPQAGCFVSGLQVLPRVAGNLRRLYIRHRRSSAVKHVGEPAARLVAAVAAVRTQSRSTSSEPPAALSRCGQRCGCRQPSWGAAIHPPLEG